MYKSWKGIISLQWKKGRKEEGDVEGEGVERQCRTLRSFLNELRIELIFSWDGGGDREDGKQAGKQITARVWHTGPFLRRTLM